MPIRNIGAKFPSSILDVKLDSLGNLGKVALKNIFDFIIFVCFLSGKCIVKTYLFLEYQWIGQ